MTENAASNGKKKWWHVDGGKNFSKATVKIDSAKIVAAARLRTRVSGSRAYVRAGVVRACKSDFAFVV